jgi:hypothetical protein
LRVPPPPQIFKSKALLNTVRGVQPKSAYRGHIQDALSTRVNA